MNKQGHQYGSEFSDLTGAFGPWFTLGRVALSKSLIIS